MPYENPIVVIAVDGPTLYAALESALSKYPAQEGCFPIVSGFRVEWNSRHSANRRVIGIWEEQIQLESGCDSEYSDTQSIHSDTELSGIVQRHIPCKGKMVSREPGDKVYTIVTGQYMAEGNDGYEALAKCKYVGGFNNEHGQNMSTIIIQYLSRLRYLKMTRRKGIEAERLANGKLPLTKEASRLKTPWKDAGHRIIEYVTRWHNKLKAPKITPASCRMQLVVWTITKALRASQTEDISFVDPLDSMQMRSGRGDLKLKGPGEEAFSEEDLPVVAPAVDGRMKNVGTAP